MALLVAGLCGCNKVDVNKLEGTWSEQYDPAVFAMDGSVEYFPIGATIGTHTGPGTVALFYWGTRRA